MPQPCPKRCLSTVLSCIIPYRYMPHKRATARIQPNQMVLNKTRTCLHSTTLKPSSLYTNSVASLSCINDMASPPHINGMASPSHINGVASPPCINGVESYSSINLSDPHRRVSATWHWVKPTSRSIRSRNSAISSLSYSSDTQ